MIGRSSGCGSRVVVVMGSRFLRPAAAGTAPRAEPLHVVGRLTSSGDGGACAACGEASGKLARLAGSAQAQRRALSRCEAGPRVRVAAVAERPVEARGLRLVDAEQAVTVVEQ